MGKGGNFVGIIVSKARFYNWNWYASWINEVNLKKCKRSTSCGFQISHLSEKRKGDISSKFNLGAGRNLL